MKCALLGLTLGCAALVNCLPPPTQAPTAPAYGEFKDPFPTKAAEPEEKPADAPTEQPPAEAPKPAPAPAPRSNHCGPACGTCSRAATACDDEVRATEKWDGPQCKRKDQVCGALVALKRATGCDCD